MKENPNYDILNNDNVRAQIPTMSTLCDYIWQDPATFLDLYLPLRLHPVTRAAVNDIILKHKPASKPPPEEQKEETPSESTKADDDDGIDIDRLYYYGVIMIKYSVVTIFKNNAIITIESADLNSIIHHTIFNVEYKIEKGEIKETELFTELCIPGMTADYRLPVFIKYYNDDIIQKGTVPDEGQNANKETRKSNFGLKMVYVCESATDIVQKKLSSLSDLIYEDLQKEQIVKFLIDSEKAMF